MRRRPPRSTRSSTLFPSTTFFRSPQAAMDSIRKNKVALKSPLTTPVGGGFSSINVELRKRFDLYANVRPAISFPNTKSRFPSGVDLITVRENTEGAYSAEGQEVSADGD